MSILSKMAAIPARMLKRASRAPSPPPRRKGGALIKLGTVDEILRHPTAATLIANPALAEICQALLKNPDLDPERDMPAAWAELSPNIQEGIRQARAEIARKKGARP